MSFVDAEGHGESIALSIDPENDEAENTEALNANGRGDSSASESELDQDETVRVGALHALAYCERLFYLEEVEELRLANAAVFAGRELHEEIAKGEGDRVERFLLASSKLGIRGRVDGLRRRDGTWIVYEHKRGRAHRGAEKQAIAWESDALQVTAYAMLLRESVAEPVVEARVKYHADNVSVRVVVDAEAEARVIASVVRARELRASTERPPVTTNERLCMRCSLAPVCLPEEERLAKSHNWEPVNLSIRDSEREAIHVMSYGSRVGRAGDQLEVSSRDLSLLNPAGSGGTTKAPKRKPRKAERLDAGAEVAEKEATPGSSDELVVLKSTKSLETKVRFPVHKVGQVVLHGGAQITTQVLHLCAENDIAVTWVSGGGRFIGSLAAGAPMVQRRIRQYKALTDDVVALGLAKRLVLAKGENQLRFVLRATRSAEREQALVSQIDGIRSSLRGAANAETVDVLLGCEGDAARRYFAAWEWMLGADVAESLRYGGRTRRPPRDRVSALLGFGYALLLGDVTSAIAGVGLESSFGFYHRPRSSAPPLALDVMELFRVIVVDMAVIGSINRGQWDETTDFAVTGERIWLSDAGRKKFVAIYEGRVAEEWKHSVVGYSLSYRRMIELEVRLLEKEWTGSPGLFAKFRLR
jgi:CRISPR-associated protein Cas1